MWGKEQLFNICGSYTIGEMEFIARKWDDLISTKNLYTNDCVILLASDDIKVNEYTLHILPVIKLKRKAKKIIVLAHESELVDRVDKEIGIDFVLWKKEEVQQLIRLYAIKSGISSEIGSFSQLMINTYVGLADNNVMKMVDVTELTMEDIVALSLMRLSKVPTEEEVINAVKANSVLNVHLSKKISWTDWEANLLYPKRLDDYKTYIEACIDNIFKFGDITKEDKVFIFGAGKDGAAVCDGLNKKCNIVGFIDNDEMKWGKIVSGLQIYSLKELEEYKSNIKIVVATQWYKEICEQLYSLGYELGKEVLIACAKSEPDYTMTEMFNMEIRGDLEAGKVIYDNLREKYPSEVIFLFPVISTGDAFIDAMYLPEMRKKYEIKNYVNVVGSKSFSRIFELFNEKSEVYELSNLKRLHRYMVLNGYDMSKCLVPYDNSLRPNAWRLHGYKNVDFNTMLQKCAFHVDKRIEKICFKQKSADELFDKYALEKGKTVVLAPYARSLKTLDLNFWETIVMQLTREGYSVCTNVATEQEKPIKGTKGILIPYSMIVDFVDKAGVFLGLRSGLCDIISGSICKKIIIYPDVPYTPLASYRDFFSLEKMGLANKEIYEIDLTTCWKDVSKTEQEQQLVNYILKTVMDNYE